MNTQFFVPFLLIVIFVISAMILLPFWFKSRLPRYLRTHEPHNIYAAIMAVFGAVLSLIPLSGWLVAIFNLLQTTASFDPDGNRLHDWSFSLYGYLYSSRWSSMTFVAILFGTSLYFLITGRKSTKS